MCDLITAFTIGSTIMGAAGQMQQASAANAAAKYNAQIGEMNAVMAERRAKDAEQRGVDAEQKKRLEVQRVMGQQKVAMAANGVDLAYGSPLDTLMDTAYLGELDALTIRTNAAREAYDYRVDAVNKRAGATLQRMEGEAALKGGYLSAAGTVLGGVGKAYGDYRKSQIGSYA